MSHFKLKADDDVRKPEVKRSEINVYMPVLFICFALAALIWLYVVGLSHITDDTCVPECTTTVSEETSPEETSPEETTDPETTAEDTAETTADTTAEVLLPDGGTRW